MFCWHLSCVFFLWGTVSHTHSTILWSTRRNGSISTCTYTFVHHIWPKMVTLIVFYISSCVIIILIIGFVCFNIMLFGPRRFTIVCFVVVQSLSRVRLSATPWTAARQASLSFTIAQSLLKLLSIEPVMPSNHLILSHPLLLLPSVFPSIRVFSSEYTLYIRWLKYWSFSFSISPSNEYSGLISFRIDWLYLLAIQGILKSLLQHHSLKPSILWHLAFFMVQLSHLHMTIGKTIDLTIQTFVGRDASAF